ncbi:MAG: hypothetical protein HYZ62_00755 [Candidatus Andersenbacteria bacterium]|nr:hypothetical protein [Candidatus Andersenbacteria bacterium]
MFGIGLGSAIGKELKEKVQFWMIGVALGVGVSILAVASAKLDEQQKPHMQIHTLAELVEGSIYFRYDTMSTTDYIHLVREDKNGQTDGILLYRLTWKNFGIAKGDIPNRFMPHWTPEGNLEFITLADKKPK